MILDDLLDLSRLQWGKRYVFGAQPATSVDDPVAFDCSGFTRWVCGRVGVHLPAGSWYQARYCRDAGTLIPIDDAIWTRGALLFRGPNQGYDGFGSDGHVAFALGNGWTSEARGTSWGVGTFTGNKTRQWTNAALIPGLDYSEAPPAPPAVVIPAAPKEADVYAITPRCMEVMSAPPDPALAGRTPGYTLNREQREVWSWNWAPLVHPAVARTQVIGLHILRLDDLLPPGGRLNGSPKDLGVRPDGGLVVLMDDGGTVDIPTD